MERILEIDIDKKECLFCVYNKKKVSKELIRYIIESFPKMKKNDTLKVVINNRIGNNIRCSELIKKGLDETLAMNDWNFHKSNIKQISFLSLGIVALIVASVIKIDILKEIVIIGAWVLLWNVVEMELVDDILNRKRKKTLEKILSSDFVENFD